MTQELILFTSPKAGSGAKREQIPRLIELLKHGGRPPIEVSSPSTLKSMIDQRSETGVSRPTVIAAGGDGTISLVAAHTDDQTPLLPMPLGTENLLARYYGQETDAEAVIETIDHGKSVQIDAGLANGRMFLIMATAGFDAEVVRQLHENRSGHIRRSSYFVPILQTLSRYRFPELTVTLMDDQGQPTDVRRAAWAMVFNLPCYAAGLNIMPDAEGDDGRLDLITFNGRGIANGLRYLIGILFGGHQNLQDVDQRRVPRMRLESAEDVAYELDGDYVGQLPIEFQTLPRRVRLLVPNR